MDVQNLVFAVSSHTAEEAFKPRLTLEQWRLVHGFLTSHTLRPGDLLAKQDDIDRTVFLIEDGTMQVFRSAPAQSAGEPPARTRIAILRPGSIVGEGGLFGQLPRLANVEATSPCKIWALLPTRWDELCLRQPTIALEFLRAAAMVYATRMRQNLANHIAFS
jgi:CRP/FNR family transcriptional regulator, cyclic AMP receptor protein